ncbi:hypothetical protein H9L13_08240 [Sphingomonas lutea]|uniref:DUF1311 domain-containing protein n=1 Tax=Sphingomonas lutea TaxID=1045317 RepID=A0A7G9SFQ4_9SPHN|nr:hypothetical protein [Sphingomonas lutea]QNN66679.1 hypothetical protein H9L13_08240 [Sphingomonas lutea]
MRRINPTVLALGGIVILLLLFWAFSANRSADQDKLTGNETAGAPQASAEQRCASKATYDLIKRDLFRRAAQTRESDQSAFDRISASAVIRMENPVMESEDDSSGAVNCSGSLSLDLPPGLAVIGGRRSLSADVDYSVQPAADGSGTVVLLRNADAIVTPLATLARVEDTASLPTPDAPPPPASNDPLAPQPPETVIEPGPTEPAPVRQGQARPSFNCANARTRGETAVCSDAGLASLDRQMAAQFNGAMSRADGEERALLQQTRGRFLSYRDSCRSDSCIADAYRGRMREISDIMSGRWQPR